MSTDPSVAAPSSRRIPFSTSKLLKALDAPGSTHIRMVDDDQSIAGPAPLVPAPDLRRGLRKPRVRTPKPPQDQKVYKVAMGCIALRAQGMKGQAVADMLGVKYDTMKSYLQRATARGWLNLSSFNDHEDKVEYVLADKAIRNANELLDERDKDMTIETLKGTGIFKQHQAVKMENTTNVGLALKVQVEMPTFSGPVPVVRPGSVGGTAGVQIPVDAEIIETK